MRPAMLLVHTPGSAQGLCAPWQQCGIRVLLASGCHQSCWRRWPAPAVSVPMSSALGAENTLLVPFQQQHKCLIKPSYTSQLAGGLGCCCPPLAGQAAVPGLRQTGEPKGQHSSTAVLRHDPAFPFASIFIPTFPLLAHVAAQSSSLGQVVEMPLTSCFSTCGCEALFACLRRANIRRA